MKAMLLAAGFGKRLKDLTATKPKPLIPIAGIPLILYNLALLKYSGVSEVVVNLHYLGNQIENLLGDGSRFGLNIEYSYEDKILGTAGGIRKALEFFPKQENILVVNADIITSFDLKSFLSSHVDNSRQVTLLLKEDPQAKSFGAVYLNTKTKKVDSILEDSSKNNSLPTIFCGVHCVHRSLIEKIELNKELCIVRNVYIPYLKAGGHIAGETLSGYWNDVGTLDRLAETEEDFAQGKIHLVYQKELINLKSKL